MSDRLAELFADRNLSYTGAGLSYAGDASGHGVTQPEQSLQIRRNVNDSTEDSTPHPFKCPKYTDGETASTVAGGTVTGGISSGFPVTNSSSTALPGGTLVISNSGTVYAYLEVTITKITTASGYVVGINSITTAKLKTAGSVPPNASTVLCHQVATYVDGTRTTQDIITSMSVAIRGYDASGNFLTFWGAS
jgi:hypothetical protein